LKLWYTKREIFGWISRRSSLIYLVIAFNTSHVLFVKGGKGVEGLKTQHSASPNGEVKGRDRETDEGK